MTLFIFILRAKKALSTWPAATLCLLLCCAASYCSPTIQLNAYNSEGKNTGTDKLNETLQVAAHIVGATSAAVIWSVDGAGTIAQGTGVLADSGMYLAPKIMPSNNVVTVTAKLVSDPSVSATYQFSLVNPTLVIKSISGKLLTATANRVTIEGTGFTPQTTILVNGNTVETIYNSWSNASATITVPAATHGMLAIAARNPAPGGGTSAIYNAAVAPVSITLTAYNSEGKNTGTDYLNELLQVATYVQGTSNTAISWSVSGAGTVAQGTGSLSTSGMYQAPSSLPANTKVTVTATLVSDPSVTASYQLSLLNPVPAIESINGQLLAAATNTVTIRGTGFTPQTSILLDGSSIVATYVSWSSITAHIPVAAGTHGTLALTAKNPAPAGGTSAVYNVPVAQVFIALTGYNSEGKNTGTDYLNETLQVSSYVQGTASPAIKWSVSGAGTIAQGTGSLGNSGMYQSPFVMPSNSAVTVTATLVSDPTVSASYHFSLLHPIPVVKSISAKLITATTNNVTIQGTGFTPQTSIVVNGKAVAATYVSWWSMSAQIPVAAATHGTLPLSGNNPSPGGGTSVTYNAPVAPVSISLNGYNSEGKNAGLDYLNETLQVASVVEGTANTAIIWSVAGAGTMVQGTGSLANSVMYQAPSSMPSNNAVTVTATLATDASVSASYRFSILNPVPSIASVRGQLVMGSTQNVVLIGTGFAPQSTVTVNGSPVAVTYQSPQQLMLSVPAPACATGSYPVVVQNPSPGGGTSASSSVPFAPITVQITASGQNGATNPVSTSLGTGVQFYATLGGAVNPAVSTPMTWAITGGGSISNNGLYRAPVSMPSSNAVSVTSAMTSCPAVSGTYPMALTNPAPTIGGTSPSTIVAGVTNTLTVRGSGFVPGTAVFANGAAVAATYSSATVLVATVPVAANAAVVSLTAETPAPGGSTSAPFNVFTGEPVPVTLSIDQNSPGLSIPEDFLGFSHEWGGETTFEGTAATGVNLAYRQLIQNLMNGDNYHFFIRIGGNSTDNSAEPSSTTVSAYSDLAQALPLIYSLGVNLASDNVQMAVDQAVNYSGNMPQGSLAALEIGNEPDLYYGDGLRSSQNYLYLQYPQEFDLWRQSIAAAVATPVPFMGPSTAEPSALQGEFPLFEQLESNQVHFVSQHYYAGCICQEAIGPDFLLQPSASGSGAALIAPAVAVAHANGQMFRVDEMNSISGGTAGGLDGVSNSFSSALWGIDTMFEFANAGADGVNWHGNKNCPFCAFSFSVNNDVTNGNAGKYVFTLSNVSPIYYGMLFFRSATPQGARLLPLAADPAINLKAWSTVDPSGTVRVAIINKEETLSGTVSFSLTGASTSAQLARLTAPSYQSTNGVTWMGQTFDGSIDGTPVGAAATEPFTSSDGTFTVTVQPASAVLITVPTSFIPAAMAHR